MRSISLLSLALLAAAPQTRNPFERQAQEQLEKWRQQQDEKYRQMASERQHKEQMASSTNLVVMIAGRLGETDLFGAGIIFGRDNDRLYIATANHVVRTRTGEATDLQVKLRTAPNKLLPAKLLPRADRELDIAALVVEGTAAAGVDVCALPLDRLDAPGALRRGANVYPVGNPNGVPWAMPVRPDAVSDIVGDQVVFQSTLIARGHSGGALLSELGQLVGMIQADEPPFGRALDLHKVVAVLKSWYYPVDLYKRGDDPPLLGAIWKGDLAAVKLLLGRGCTDLKGRLGNMALDLAVSKGRNEFLELLLDAGAKTDGGVLRSAAEAGNVETIRIMLARGASVNPSDKYETPLMAASRAGKIEAVRLLLAKGADPNGAGTQKTTAVYSAIGKDPDGARLRILQALTQGGANVNWKDVHGETPLMYAVRQHAEETAILQLLLKAGADVCAKDQNGRSALDSIYNREMAVLLLPYASKIPPQDGEKLLRQASQSGWGDVVALLLERGVDSQGKPVQEQLVESARMLRTDVVRALLEHGAPPDGDGREAPLLALLQDHYRLPKEGLQILELLVSKGANVNLADGRPLSVVLHKGLNPDLKALEFLVDHGAKVRPEYIDDARRLKNQEVVDILLKAKR